jgi:hypothetical protein
LDPVAALLLSVLVLGVVAILEVSELDIRIVRRKE